MSQHLDSEKRSGLGRSEEVALDKKSIIGSEESQLEGAKWDSRVCPFCRFCDRLTVGPLQGVAH